MTYEEMSQRGIDYDLQGCLDWNDIGIEIDQIINVLAVIEGENDKCDWHWILRLSENAFALVTGGCDYTGWDCQSWGEKIIVEADRPSDLDAHIDSFFGKCEMCDYQDKQEVIDSLKYQIRHGRKATWRIKMDAELGVQSIYGGS